MHFSTTPHRKSRRVSQTPLTVRTAKCESALAIYSASKQHCNTLMHNLWRILYNENSNGLPLCSKFSFLLNQVALSVNGERLSLGLYIVRCNKFSWVGQPEHSSPLCYATAQKPASWMLTMNGLQPELSLNCIQHCHGLRSNKDSRTYIWISASIEQHNVTTRICNWI